MLEAWSEGFIKNDDLQPVLPWDRLWWFRLHTRLNSFEQKRYREYLQLSHRQNLAGSSVGTGDFANKSWTRSVSDLDDLHRSLFRWISREKKDTTTEIRELKNSWEAMFGKFDDPETQARINATARQLSAGKTRNR